MLRETLFCTEFSVVSWFLQVVPWCSLHSALKKATVPRITKDMSPMKTNRNKPPLWFNSASNRKFFFFERIPQTNPPRDKRSEQRKGRIHLPL